MYLANTELKNVKPSKLEPCQRPTPLSFQKQCDFSLQQFIKHKPVSEFHSYAEKLHACLLEADHTVSCFVPQPLSLYRSGKLYPPDCYYFQSGQANYIELKPEKTMADFDETFWKCFFEFKGAKFRLISNESILENETLALNWLGIVKVILDHQYLDTSLVEFEILDRLCHQSSLALGDFVDPGARKASLAQEVGIFRLAHQGKVAIKCEHRQLDWDTEVTTR